MSVPELIKSALPVAGPQVDAGSVGTAAKVASPLTPLRVKSQPQPASTGGSFSFEKSESINVPIKGKMVLKAPEEFYKDLQQFHERRATPITHMPKISGRIVDLHRLYSEVTERGGFVKVNNRDEWEEVIPELGFREKCVNATAAIKHIYRRCLEKYERLNFFGEDPDKMEALEASDSLDSGRSRARYPSTMLHNSGGVNTVPMSYNYRQHFVNMDRRRMYRMSTDLHKPSQYEKLMLSLISPLPNEQDFAINVCTLMVNEGKHTLKINEYPKLLDALLSHTGVFPNYSMRKLFQHVYQDIRGQSLSGFWRDLLHDKPQILELYSDEQAIRDAALINEVDDLDLIKQSAMWDETLSMDFLNLGRSVGKQDFMGQRVQQILGILRNLSFIEDNLQIFAKNRCFLRFIVMGANVRWGTIHNQALDIAGNVATELELFDPTSDELSRSLMATLCDGIEGTDRAVIISCLEILYKLCQKNSNEDHIYKCLNLKFYQTMCLFLSLNDIMLLIFTLEAIYALSSMGARSCHLIMQVRGVVDQLVSLITVEAQSYGPDGCILMRVVETVPGNMLPMVAQNIANLQSAAVIQKQHQVLQSPTVLPQPLQPQSVSTHEIDTPSQPQQNANPPTTPKPPPQNFTHEDEQYALAWLGATFERAASVESHVEQQELYRMYLSHCQKSGKHSVVNHLQFPRLVRLIYTNNVGPVAVRRSDGTELAGFHYVAIRVRAQPLPIQTKLSQSPQKTELGSSRKTKKKLKLQQDQQLAQQQQPQPLEPGEVIKEENTTVGEAATSAIEQPKTNTSKEIIRPDMEAVVSAIGQMQCPIEDPSTSDITPKTEDCSKPTNSSHSTITTVLVQPSVDNPNASHSNSQQVQMQSQLHQQPSSSLIKSLLANKVTQRQQKQKELTAASAMQTTTHTNVIATTPSSQLQQQPIKVTSTAISALVNNPLMQNTSVKVGQTTIKPLNPQPSFEKKQLAESVPPPLAPLSGNNVAKDASGRPVLIANQMLVEILDKKIVDPPIPATIIKRKLDDTSNIGTDSAKRMSLEVVTIKEETQATPSKNAANLYAEMAASILEDEDLDDIPPLPTQLLAQQTSEQTIMMPTKIQQAPMQNVQRQLLFQTNQSPQLKLTQATNQQIPTAMATIKTDQGLQTVPVILQQKQMDQTQPQIIQQVIQQNTNQQPQQTQYVLATNPQGQTYLVAQQPQQPQQQQPDTQTVLVTQTPQQHSAGTKTIIILQQQAMPTQQQQQQIITSGGSGAPKMYMTTPQGQVLVTQRSQPTMGSQNQPQFFINPQTGAATHIQHVPVSTATMNALQTQSGPTILQRQIIQSPALGPQVSQHQQQAGQISPSILSQLNHIPATIKLHQPQVTHTTQAQQLQHQQHQQATISRLGKSVSIVQTSSALAPPPPIQIPQLQQHQSIIQQHIISGPPEKRQVILGGRAIEIKETVITQTQPPPQQSQLNSQTIITTQPPVQQQQPQPIRAIIEQQQHHQQQQQHPSIIQKKISVPLQQTQTQALLSQKVYESPNLTQTTLLNKSVSQPQTVVQAIVSQAPPTQATITTIKKASGTVAAQIKHQQQSQISMAVPKPAFSTVPVPLSVAATTAEGATSVIIQPTMTTASHTLPQLQQDIIKDIKTEELNTATITTTTTMAAATSTAAQPTASVQQPQPLLSAADANWLYVCDWRNCPRRKFKSVNDLQHHACTAHCPDHLDPGAEIFCQWGLGPSLCDGIPRKRYSLMTHLIDRHLTVDSLRTALQRRIATGVNNIQPTQPPVTIVRNVDQAQRGSTASPALSTSSTGSLPSTGSSAIHAIKRHSADFVNPKELMDENEGPVTKSIRLTAALILRNLVTYTSTAKRTLRRYEPHLANVALSNVESSGAISHILYELNN